ncbi:MAG: hypothetical protein ACLPH3_00400 [Terracidiphilus sp.]
MSGIEDKAEIQHICTDHQLSAPVPWYRTRWILWAGALLMLLLAAIVISAYSRPPTTMMAPAASLPNSTL